MARKIGWNEIWTEKSETNLCRVLTESALLTRRTEWEEAPTSSKPSRSPGETHSRSSQGQAQGQTASFLAMDLSQTARSPTPKIEY